MPAVFPTIIVVHLSISANVVSDATTTLTKMLARTVLNILRKLICKLGLWSAVHHVTWLICDSPVNVALFGMNEVRLSKYVSASKTCSLVGSARGGEWGIEYYVAVQFHHRTCNLHVRTSGPLSYGPTGL